MNSTCQSCGQVGSGWAAINKKFSRCVCGAYRNIDDLLAGGLPKGEVNTDWDLIRRDVEKFIPILSYIEELRGGKKGGLVDIGCSSGYLLWLAKLRGWIPFGIDVKEAAAKAAKKTFDLDDVVVGEFEETYIPAGAKFDCFIFHHGIEHLRSPRKAIKKAIEHLAKEGIIYMSHPVMPDDDRVNDLLSEGHQYEWNFNSFERLIRSLPLKIIKSDCGFYGGGPVPASQTWVVTHEDSNGHLPRD